MTKDYTKAADELARKIAREFYVSATHLDTERVLETIHSHTGSTLAELLADKERLDWVIQSPSWSLADVRSRQAINQAMKEEQ